MTRRRSPHLPLRPRLRSPLARRQLRRAAGHVSDGALVGARHDRLHRSADPQSAARRLPRSSTGAFARAPTVSRSPSAPGAHARPRHGRRGGPLRLKPAEANIPLLRKRAEPGRRARSHARGLRGAHRRNPRRVHGRSSPGRLRAQPTLARRRSGDRPRHLTLRRLLRRLAHAPGSAVVPRARVLRARRGAAAAARLLGGSARSRRDVRGLLRPRTRRPDDPDRRGRRAAKALPPTRSLLVASDLHSNGLVLRASSSTPPASRSSSSAT